MTMESYQQPLPLDKPTFWRELQMRDPHMEMFTQTSYTADVISLHSHAFYEILFCTGGNLNYLLDGKRYKLEDGDILLIPPGISHRPLFLETLTVPYCRIVLWFNAKFWRESVTECPQLDFCFSQCRKRDSYLLRCNPATRAGLLAGFHSVMRELEQKRLGWEYLARLGALTLMAHISRTYYYRDIASPVAEMDSLLDNVFLYIDNNLHKNLTLGNVATHFLVSPSTISHLFSKKLGVSFYHCVVQRRLIAAKNSILSSMPLQDVCENCGFSDYSCFYRLFKKEFGISPKAFRTLHMHK